MSDTPDLGKVGVPHNEEERLRMENEELRDLIRRQGDQIDRLVQGIDKLAFGLDRRPTLLKTVVVVAAIVLLGQAATVWYIRDSNSSTKGIVEEIREQQVVGRQHTLSNQEILAQIDDCLDTLPQEVDGDPIGACAQRSAQQFADAVAAVTLQITCSQYSFLSVVVALNPELDIQLPALDPRCETEG